MISVRRDVRAKKGMDSVRSEIGILKSSQRRSSGNPHSGRVEEEVRYGNKPCEELGEEVSGQRKLQMQKL